jgi:hypothetical protein
LLISQRGSVIDLDPAAEQVEEFASHWVASYQASVGSKPLRSLSFCTRFGIWTVASKWRRWSLHLGDTRQLLATILNRLGLIDTFVHDRLLSYEHIRFEYQQAYPHLRPGILISDDALWNPALSEFAQYVGLVGAQILRGVGVIKKPAL